MAWFAAAPLLRDLFDRIAARGAGGEGGRAEAFERSNATREGGGWGQGSQGEATALPKKIEKTNYSLVAVGGP